MEAKKKSINKWAMEMRREENGKGKSWGVVNNKRCIVGKEKIWKKNERKSKK